MIGGEHKVRVALVDDAESVRRLVRLHLELDGRFEVVGEGSDGIEAIGLVESTRPDLLIIDLCQPRNWRQLHLPGAVHCDVHELVRGTPPAPGKLPLLPQLEALFARIGYAPHKHIVVYDDEGGGWAGRFIGTS